MKGWSISRNCQTADGSSSVCRFESREAEFHRDAGWLGGLRVIIMKPFLKREFFYFNVQKDGNNIGEIFNKENVCV